MGEKILNIGITIGDTNGVGAEVIIKALADSAMLDIATPVIYGSSKVINYYRNRISEAGDFAYSVVSGGEAAKAGKINLVEVISGEIAIEAGKPSKESGEAAVAALERAVKDLKAGSIDALVTAPINKESVQSARFDYTGHTEFLAAEFGAEPLMLMCSDVMRVGLATIHLPVDKIADAINKDLIVKRLHQLKKSLTEDFKIIEPRIAVLALNPHAGDGGLLGTQESESINPAIVEANAQGVLAFGAFAADGFFASATYKKYDAILAMYHDQGLAPFKMISPDGVNFTAGLPIVRTSPDHGVAYDIAGEDKADPQSMRAAIYTAVDIVRARRWYAEISANPLKHYERERGRDVSVKDLELEEK